jgi:AcrR family transcriptional regulator
MWMATGGTTDRTPATRRRSGPVTRRRGAALQAALLQAAWDELTDVGYGAFTMEGVAVRAKTSRAVLYRRWPTRTELVLAALRQHWSLSPLEVPDTGTLREDLLGLLRHVSDRAGEVAGVFSFLMADYFSETGLPLSALRERVLVGAPDSMTVIVDRAVGRGEINPARISPRALSLPVDLVRHDLLMTQSSVPDATLVEIVDDIFLPLVRGHLAST